MLKTVYLTRESDGLYLFESIDSQEDPSRNVIDPSPHPQGKGLRAFQEHPERDSAKCFHYGVEPRASVSSMTQV